MIATEELRIQEVVRDAKTGTYQVKPDKRLRLSLTDIALSYGDENIVIPALSPDSSEILSLCEIHEEPQPEGDYLDLRAKYKDGVIRFRTSMINPLPNLKIDIYNLRGQRVSSKSFAEGGSNNLSIPFVNRASGVYFARIELGRRLSENR